MSRRLLVALVAAGAVAAVLAGLVAAGRWERNRDAARQNAEMAAVYRRATAAGLISSRLDLYRLAQTFDCLLYHPAAKPTWVSAYELCFDPTGRLVETIDRRTDPPRIASLREQPALATLKVPVPRILRALQALGGFTEARLAGMSVDRTTLPVGYDDQGAYRFAPPIRSSRRSP